ncbi:hypothetical protein M422DRAFT_36439 [Sphaerobolus stellatus SS14]|uniref:Uncharacterized protein n=1 Tax=Sphaerobolus stellatus (strain SS14) TaxID=990650 RepID=A0A0C9UP78_SPHS4|nr:hypothetical protein M422DRAFT_36439 [Sphaerobolus stellatus SS14]
MPSYNPVNPFRDQSDLPQNASGISGNPEGMAQANHPGNSITQETSSILDMEDISTEAPPAYTPIADAYRGEEPLEFGPTRPFQPATRPLQSYGSNNPSVPHIAPESTPNRLAPPPRHPSTVARPASLSPSVTSSIQSMHSPPAVEGHRHSASVGPISGQGRSYNPPPGSPPGRSPIQSNPSVPPNPSTTGQIPNDRRPTTTPTPGHPLLKDGKTLVYPAGYTCSKCQNTGYKNYDPSHPCRKCWQKYARNYTGAIAYAPSASESSSSVNPFGSFQRPLPAFTPPHAGISRPHSTTGYPGQAYRGSNPIPPSSAMHPPNIYHLPPPPMPFGGPFGPPPMPPMTLYPPSAPVSPIYQGPPAFPTPLVVPPGDPRIGGRLCWRCDGRGRVSGMFLIDTEMCSVCQGTGRTFI